MCFDSFNWLRCDRKIQWHNGTEIKKRSEEYDKKFHKVSIANYNNNCINQLLIIFHPTIVIIIVIFKRR